MKREKYHISVNQIRLRTKYAWNSARREVPVVLKEFFLHHGGNATKQGKGFYTRERNNFIYGEETWITDKGIILKVRIQKA